MVQTLKGVHTHMHVCTRVHTHECTHAHVRSQKLVLSQTCLFYLMTIDQKLELCFDFMSDFVKLHHCYM